MRRSRNFMYMVGLMGIFIFSCVKPPTEGDEEGIDETNPILTVITPRDNYVYTRESINGVVVDHPTTVFDFKAIDEDSFLKFLDVEVHNSQEQRVYYKKSDVIGTKYIHAFYHSYTMETPGVYTATLRASDTKGNIALEKVTFTYEINEIDGLTDK